MMRSTIHLSCVSGLVTFMLACFCSNNGDELLMEDYVVEFEHEQGGNTKDRYFLVAPMPV